MSADPANDAGVDRPAGASSRWSPRQHDLLQAMGVRAWWPGRAVAEPATPAHPAHPAPPVMAAPAAAPSPAPHTQPRPTPGLPAAPASPRVAPRGAATSTPAKPAAARDTTADPARRDRLAVLDWPALQQAVADCTACGLCRQRRQSVFGVGPTNARWLIVGEAPGEQEDRQGEPFVGPAGQMLDAMLQAIGLSRSPGASGPGGVALQPVYITNTLKCRPPGNRNPTAAEIGQCQPFLDRQIALLQPRLILALGRVAVQAVLQRDDPIGRLRGQVHQAHGLPVVVSYHPSYLLRSPLEKARAWEDLCFAADTMEALGPEPAGASSLSLPAPGATAAG